MREMLNPLLQNRTTPYGTPPFDLIKPEHFLPAVKEAVKSAGDEIDRISDNTEAPDFNNTVVTLERSGASLDEITLILFNLNSAETNKELQAVAQEVSPLLARFSNDITLNRRLFERIRSVYENKELAPPGREQEMLLEKTYRNFILGGAGLDESKRKRYREISEELSGLTLKFEENVLDETNSFELHLTDPDDLAGLPEGTLEMAAMEASRRGKEGWVFTLHYPSYVPFMQYCDNRALREKMFKAYTSRSFHGDERDNRDLIKRIVNLRLELSNILGFSTYAEMTLTDRMADTTSKVNGFLEELHSASKSAAVRDLNNLKEFALRSRHSGELERWDWLYYSEKLRKDRYDIDDEVLKPYFVLENTEKAIFSLAGTLYGLTFTEISSIPLYHSEVKTWEVRDHDGSFIALLYTDYFPREGKSGGAWMTSYREQHSETGKDVRPLISIVANFTRATQTRPSLLTFTEVTTFLHEFGHALHGMLSKCTFESLSGTSVARDFVELPSQFMENYAYEKDWLSSWALHYRTGEPLPVELIEKIRESATFNEGYACNRQLGFAFLDMCWHTISAPFEENASGFESAAMAKTELFLPVEGASMSASFTHIFGGGYAAGYYGYKWAEVLDADAFQYFKETGIFNKQTAGSFRKNILEKGGTDKPSVLYKNFRGKEPSPEAFLVRSGLK